MECDIHTSQILPACWYCWFLSIPKRIIHITSNEAKQMHLRHFSKNRNFFFCCYRSYSSFWLHPYRQLQLIWCVIQQIFWHFNLILAVDMTCRYLFRSIILPLQSWIPKAFRILSLHLCLSNSLLPAGFSSHILLMKHSVWTRWVETCPTHLSLWTFISFIICSNSILPS